MEVQARFEQDLRHRPTRARSAERGGPGQHLRTELRWRSIASAERIRQARVALLEVPPHVPELRQRAGKPQLRVQVATVDRPPQGRPKVVVLPLEPLQPRLLAAAEQLRFGALGQIHKEGGVPRLHRLQLATGVKPLPRVLADRLQQPEAWLAVRLHLPIEQALGQQGANCLLGVPVGVSRVRLITHRRCRLERQPAREYGQPPEEALLAGRQQGVAPFDRLAQGPVALRQVTRSVDQHAKRALHAA